MNETKQLNQLLEFENKKIKIKIIEYSHSSISAKIHFNFGHEIQLQL
jgi:hypothetical protein